jgi:hypothetical protein
LVADVYGLDELTRAESVREGTRVHCRFSGHGFPEGIEPEGGPVRWVDSDIESRRVRQLEEGVEPRCARVRWTIEPWVEL